MRVAIIAVGRLKAGPERELADRYGKRIGAGGRALGLSALDIRELDESRARRPDARRRDEARAIEAALAPGGVRIVLDERGRDWTSEAFADFLRGARDENRALDFVIGGPDGLDRDFLSQAGLRLRLGAMTLPHGLARVLLLEQIYRATTILAGHPYHRGG